MIFAAAKVFGYLTWSWLWVFSPLWIPLVTIAAIAIVVVVILFILSLLKVYRVIR